MGVALALTALQHMRGDYAAAIDWVQHTWRSRPDRAEIALRADALDILRRMRGED